MRPRVLRSRILLAVLFVHSPLLWGQGKTSILGYAVENGALMKSESGTTITFRGNPVGIIKALRQQGFIESFRDDDPATRLLRRFSLALSFDTNRGVIPGTFTGDRQQISSYSFRLDVFNRRDPRDVSYGKKWADLINSHVQGLTTASSKFAEFFDNDPTLGDWLRSAREALTKATADQTETVIKGELAKLRSLRLPAEIDALLAGYKRDVEAFLAGRQNILDEASNGLIVTFEYTNIREVDAPDLSSFKFIVEGAPWKGKIDLTTNASFTIFNSIPSGSNLKRVRDFQLSGQIDVPLGDIRKVGNFVLSFSGKYERMMENAMMPGGVTVADTKGNIAIGQLKLTIPAKGTGVKIPISLTIANRTELIKESDVRGNIGITFDLDSIFAKLKP